MSIHSGNVTQGLETLLDLWGDFGVCAARILIYSYSITLLNTLIILFRIPTS